jgi:hypothetical protein
MAQEAWHEHPHAAGELLGEQHRSSGMSWRAVGE